MSKRLPEGEGKRVPLNMRTTWQTRFLLENAAEKSGRSLAQEVEYRLERSFWNEDVRTVLAEVVEESQARRAIPTIDRVFLRLREWMDKHEIGSDVEVRIVLGSRDEAWAAEDALRADVDPALRPDSSRISEGIKLAGIPIRFIGRAGRS